MDDCKRKNIIGNVIHNDGLYGNVKRRSKNESETIAIINGKSTMQAKYHHSNSKLRNRRNRRKGNEIRT